MKQIFFLSLAAFCLVSTSACNLYRSTDREFFDLSGSAGRPAGVVVTPLTTSCEKIENDLSPASLMGLDLRNQEEDISISRDTSLSRASVLIARKSVEHLVAKLCRFEFAEPVNEQDLMASSRSLVESTPIH